MASFAGPNGANPYSGLCLASDGNFYGTTHQGGINGWPLGLGSVYRVTPNGVLTVLASFGSMPNGNKPYAALIQAPDGFLYGTTWQGGTANSGTFYRISTNGALTTLLSFTGANGARPSGRLTLGVDGHLYGTTQLGGAHSLGTVFRVSTNGSLTTLASFDGTNGANPYAEVFLARDGHFYGTTVNGGVSNLGTIFRVSTNGALVALASFTNANGANPYGGLVADASDVLYGTTAYGGSGGFGTVFRTTTNGVLTTLHSFAGSADGDNPRASLLLARDGKLYGTTTLGGAANGGSSWGTIFQISTNGQLAVLVSFNYDSNGISPYCALVQDAEGYLYGTTFSQGVGLKGTVFRVSPGAPVLLPNLQTGNTIRLDWKAWPGLGYQLQYKSGAAGAPWQNLTGTLVPTNRMISVVDSIQPGSTRFYRVKRLTSP